MVKSLGDAIEDFEKRHDGNDPLRASCRLSVVSINSKEAVEKPWLPRQEQFPVRVFFH